MVIVAMAGLGLVDSVVPVIAETAGLWQFQVIRSTMALAALMALARWRGWRLRPRRWPPVAGRSAILSVALILYFAALAVLPLAEAVAGLFTAPLWITAIAALRPGGRVRPVQAVAALIGFAGVLLVLRPDAGGIGWTALLPAMSGLFYGLAQMATRDWCAGETAATLLAGFFVAMGLWGIAGLGALALVTPSPEAVQAAGWALRHWGAMAPAAWAGTVGQAVVSLLAVGLIIRAYQAAEAPFVAVFEYALLLFAVIWGWLLFGQAIGAAAAAGIGLILASGALGVLGGAGPHRQGSVRGPVEHGGVARRGGRPAGKAPAGRWRSGWRARR